MKTSVSAHFPLEIDPFYLINCHFRGFIREFLSTLLTTVPEYDILCAHPKITLSWSTENHMI